MKLISYDNSLDKAIRSGPKDDCVLQQIFVVQVLPGCVRHFHSTVCEVKSHNNEVLEVHKSFLMAKICYSAGSPPGT